MAAGSPSAHAVSVSRPQEWFIAGGCLLLITGIWLADRVASDDFRFGFLYMLPLAGAAWWAPRCIALSCASVACIALVFNDLSLRPANALISNVWNEFTRATTFFALVTLMSLVRDSSVRIRAESERAFQLAVTDQLTGLYNRRYLMEQLQRIDAAAVRHQRPYALLAIDLDGFKRINDLLGHAAGDAALVGFANDLTELVRAEDIAVRTGGDEFLVVLPDARAQDAAALGERILRRVSAQTTRQQMSLSAGVSWWRSSASVETLLAEADRRVYESKRRGGGRVTMTPEAQSA
jgi:diguanylate cyclase (GGDEF)-like protein